MPDEPDTTPRQRFTWDLRRVREARDVTVAEIHEATQISESQIEAFETGGLYDQPAMNPVYLRAFVRAYAEVVGLPPDAAVQHLEASLDGSYEHEIATEHLDVPPSVVEDPSPGLSEEGLSEEEVAEVEKAEEIDPETGASEDPGREDDRENADNVLVDRAISRDAPSHREPSTPGGSSSPGPSSRRSDAARHKRSWGVWAARNRALLLTGLGILVLLGVVGALGISYLEGPAPSEESAARSLGPSPTSAPADSSASSDSRPQATLTLGDTLHVTVLATSSVRELRVRQDDDLRRPYWIEEGEATVFPFTRRITIENQLDEARLFLEQYPYPTTRTDSLGRVVIDRQTVEAFADTLRGSPTAFSVEPDTVAIRTPSSEEVDK